MINKKKKSLKGFTLVELVVTIAVIAILAGVAVGAYFGITNSTRVKPFKDFFFLLIIEVPPNTCIK